MTQADVLHAESQVRDASNLTPGQWVSEREARQRRCYCCARTVFVFVVARVAITTSAAIRAARQGVRRKEN